MINKLFKLIVEIVSKRSNSSYIKYLQKHGVKIGTNTKFFYPLKTTIDTQNGIFISIGDCCKITQGVIILAHDYSYSVLRPVYHIIPKKANETIIGNNVFIGMNSIILMGTSIGDNTIIGAGSVVSGNIPSNEVWGGNPAHFICTLEEYKNKCVKNFEKSAKIVVKQYNERLNRNPNIQELQYFSTLFLNNNLDKAKAEYKKMIFSGDKKEEVEEDCLKQKSKYKDYNDFIDKMKH